MSPFHKRNSCAGPRGERPREPGRPVTNLMQLKLTAVWNLDRAASEELFPEQPTEKVCNISHSLSTVELQTFGTMNKNRWETAQSLPDFQARTEQRGLLCLWCENCELWWLGCVGHRKLGLGPIVPLEGRKTRKLGPPEEKRFCTNFDYNLN